MKISFEQILGTSISSLQKMVWTILSIGDLIKLAKQTHHIGIMIKKGMYTAIGYICLVASIFMIKSDVIKQQMELIKIREKMREQKEQEAEEKNKPEEKEEKKEEEDKKEETDKEPTAHDDGAENQGSHA